jgi:hypothetical protein
MPLKIYDQTLPEIYKKMPLPYKIIVWAAGAFFALIIVMVPLQFYSLKAEQTDIVPIVIFNTEGKSTNIFDPAIAVDKNHAMAMLAYSSIEPPENPQKDTGTLVMVRLAFMGGKNCTTWVAKGIGFTSKPDDIIAPDGYSSLAHGVWRIETPSLVYDPDDKGHEWKLYAYKYFWSGNMSLARHYGMIVYKDATDPQKDWSQEQWLFGAAPDYPPPPYDQMVPFQLSALSPELRGITAYSRPSVIYREGYLLMTLSAFKGDETTPDRIVMLISGDHGRKWQYIGTVLQKSDVAKIGAYTVLSGATLVEQEGQVYLAAVLGDDVRQGRGTFIFGFDRLGKGLLKRDSKGVPVLLNKMTLEVDTPDTLGGNFIAYNDYCTQGALASQHITGKPAFKIYKTFKKPIEKK